MPFASTFSRPSTSEPGVTFTVRRMGFSRRADIDFTTLKWRQRLRELEADQPQASDEEKLIGGRYLIAVRKAQALADMVKTGDAGEEDVAAARAEATTLKAELEAAIPHDVRRARTVINEEYQNIQARITAEWIREGLVSIAGSDFEGMTAAQLLDYGPQELALEIYGALLSDGRLDGAAQKNLQPLSTSGAVAGGKKTITIAPDAGAPPAAGISKETASAIL
jgi:hypothetical protein